MSTLEACLFDVFGTVVDWRTSVIRECREFGERNRVDADWEAIADAWRGKYQPSMEKVRSGERPWTKLDDLHRESLLELLEAHGIAAPGEAEIERLNHAWHRLDPWPDSVEGIGRLKARYIVGTLSNGNVALLVDMAKRTRIPWDVILGAEVARAYKPLPESYLRTCELLGRSPDRVMLVAAHNDDLRHARSHGMRTAFVARPTEYGPHQDRDFAADEDWDVVADSITGVADALGC